MSSQKDFFENIDPKNKLDKPEKFPEDYENNLEENCLSCGAQSGLHTIKQLVHCALNELRGETPKG